MDILLNLIHPAGQLPPCNGPFKTIGTRNICWKHPVPWSSNSQNSQSSNNQNFGEKSGNIISDTDHNGRNDNIGSPCIQWARGGEICENAMHKHGLLLKLIFPVSKRVITKHQMQNENVRKASYVPEERELRNVIKKMMKPMPGFLVDYYLRMRTNSLVGAPIWSSSTEYDIGPNADHTVPNADGGETKSGGQNEQKGIHDESTVASDKLPVIIFSHGLYGMPEFYSSYCESLASHGYLVIAPYHTDQSAMHIIYPDGKTHIQFGKPAEPNENDSVLMEKEYILRHGQLLERIENVMFILDTLEKIDAVEMDWPEMSKSLQRDKEKEKQRHEQHNMMNADEGEEENDHYREITDRERDVLWWKQTDGASFLKGHFDASRIGIVGHSFGSCTALASMLHEQLINRRRLLAGLSFDGWLFPLRDFKDPLVHNNPLKRPFFFINSSHWQWKENIDRMFFFLRSMYQYQRRMYDGYEDDKEHREEHASRLVDLATSKRTADMSGTRNATANHEVKREWLDLYGSLYVVDGTLHQNFSDIAVLMPRFGKRLRALGPVDSLTALQEQLKILNQFLQYNVKLEKTTELRNELQKYWFQIERHDALLKKDQANGNDTTITNITTTATTINTTTTSNVEEDITDESSTSKIRFMQGGVPAHQLLKVTALASPPSPVPDKTTMDHEMNAAGMQL